MKRTLSLILLALLLSGCISKPKPERETSVTIDVMKADTTDQEDTTE